jgi:hypothetical protein
MLVMQGSVQLPSATLVISNFAMYLACAHGQHKQHSSAAQAARFAVDNDGMACP